MEKQLLSAGMPGLYKMSMAESIQERQERMNVMKKALGMPMDSRGQSEFFMRDDSGNPILVKRDSDGKPILEKASLSTAGGLVTYDLRDPSLHLIPWLSPLRDKLPRVDKSAKAGTTAHWKSIFASSIVQGSYQASPWINEGSRAPLFTFSAADESANYVTIGQDGSVTYEAQAAAVAMEDANATARFFTLEGMMTREEDALIGGNNSLKLGTVGTVTPAASGTGTLANATYYTACVALTYEGYRNSTVLGGVATQKTIITPDGKTMTVNGGSSNKSAISASQATTGVQNLTASVAPIAGAFAYAWYIGTANAAASLYLQQITTVSKMTQSVPVVTTTQTADKITTDLSVNDGTTGGGTAQVKAFDGFLVQAANAAAGANTNAYYQDLAGAGLTSSGAGGINEIDTMLAYMWNNFRTSVTEIYVNAQELKNITKGVLTGASAPLLRYNVSGDGENYDMIASGTISFYFNPYMPGGGMKIPVMVHPTLPPGTIFAYAERLPAYFKTNSTPTVAEVLCRRDYYSIDWAPRTREYEFGVYSEEVLAVYAPFCLGVITNAANSVT